RSRAKKLLDPAHPPFEAGGSSLREVVGRSPPDHAKTYVYLQLGPGTSFALGFVFPHTRKGTVMRPFLLSAFFLASISIPFALTACDSDDSSQGGSEDEIRARFGLEGESCNAVRRCMTGLVCKEKSHGPPPGAVGVPLPPSESHGPPPGAMGMPVQPEKTCQ